MILVSTCDVFYGRHLATGLTAGFLPKDDLSLAAILQITGPGTQWLSDAFSLVEPTDVR